ncbi:MAG: hypothetical protein CMK76_13320 [Pseudomonadales bacterium]|nr:hypothetical protein [Pseudomonadales bacterium]
MWKRPLKQAFGIVDKRFAGHPSDKERAREARKLINSAGVSWEEIEEEIGRILQGCTAEHLQAQLAAARKFFKL